MRLTTKGLLLIAIPAFFELALLSGLVKAQSDAALAERWAIHSEDVLRQTAAILDPVMGESVALRGAVLAQRHPLYDAGGGVDGRRPPHRPTGRTGRRQSRAGRARGADASGSAGVSPMVGPDSRHAAFGTAARRGRALPRSRRSRCARSLPFAGRSRSRPKSGGSTRCARAQQTSARERQQTLIVAAALGSLLFVALAIWLFTRGVRGRLALAVRQRGAPRGQ